jgi:hypothetical protein
MQAQAYHGIFNFLPSPTRRTHLGYFHDTGPSKISGGTQSYFQENQALGHYSLEGSQPYSGAHNTTTSKGSLPPSFSENLKK